VKKILLVLLITLFSVGYALAQEIKISGEAKSGILWQEAQSAGYEKDVSKVRLGSKDDAGDNEGRVRINLDYDNGNGFGMKFRIDWQGWNANYPDYWRYAYGYGNFFDDQLTVSVGKLGGSPWGTGGPEQWKELEMGLYGGMRVEWKPNFIPEQYGKFNIGFVLNSLDDVNEATNQRDAQLVDILMESVLGFSYTHDFFHIRFAYRLDSELDNRLREADKEGDKMVYRVEERILKNYLPGLQVWALGFLQGIGADREDYYDFRNYFFAEYSPPELGNLTTPFTAQIRLGLDSAQGRGIYYIKPNFYWHFFNKLISAGVMFGYAQDFGKRINDKAPYTWIEVEPKIQLNFSSSYIAIVYNLHNDWKADDPRTKGADPIRQTQFINLRFCIYY
jgi:hypothetical protein